MNVSRLRTACAVLVAVLATQHLVPSASAQTLVGDTIELWRHPQLTGEASLDSFAIVSSPGHEWSIGLFDDVWYTIDVEATSIRFNVLHQFYSPYFDSGHAPTALEIRDLDFIGEPDRHIVDVVVRLTQGISVHADSPLDWPQFSTDNVTFTPDSVRISYGGYEFYPGESIHIDLITAVPEPATAALLACGGFLLMCRRR